MLLQSRMNSVLDIRLFGCQNILEFLRRYVMPHLDIQLFKGQQADNQSNTTIASVRLKQNSYNRNYIYQQYMHMYPPSFQQQYIAQTMMHQYQQQFAYNSNSLRPGSVNSSTGGSGFQNRGQQSQVPPLPPPHLPSSQQQQLQPLQNYSTNDDLRSPYYHPHQEFYNFHNILPFQSPQGFWNQNYIRQQSLQQQMQIDQQSNQLSQQETAHHQKRSTNYTTESYDSYYNYYDYQHNRGSIDSVQNFHNYQPSTASVIYNPSAGGDMLQNAFQIQNKHQDNNIIGHSRSNTDTQLPSSTMVQRNSSNNQDCIYFNSPVGNNGQGPSGAGDKRTIIGYPANEGGTNFGESAAGGGGGGGGANLSLSSASNGVRFAWGSGYPFIHSGCPLFPTNSWIDSNSSGGGGGGRRFNNSTFSNGSGYSPHFGSGNYFYDFSPHAFYAKGGNRQGSPEHNRTVSFLNVNSNPGSMDLTGASGSISGGIQGDVRQSQQQQQQQKVLKGQSQLGAAVGNRQNMSVNNNVTTGGGLMNSSSSNIGAIYPKRDLRQLISEAGNPVASQFTETSGAVTETQQQNLKSNQVEKNSSEKQQNERLNTSGVLQEESIVKSIEQIIDSQEAKDSNESPINFQMTQSNDDEKKEEHIKIIQDSPKNFDEQFDMQMQIPSQQGGVWGPVPVWGGINNNQGHLKAFSTDFWVWSKRQVQNPAQQTKYFSTNQGNHKNQWDNRQRLSKQQSKKAADVDEDAQKISKNPQKLEEIKELQSDIDSNL